MTLGEESRRYDPTPSPALSCYTGTEHDGARGSGTRLYSSALLYIMKSTGSANPRLVFSLNVISCVMTEF